MAAVGESGATTHDVVVIGGGPSGSIAALRAARHGLRVVLVERDRHPRFQIGESFLPKNLELLRDLGLEAAFREVPHVPKYGGSFLLGHEEETADFHFENGMLPTSHDTFNVERAPFDAFLLDAARGAGVEVRERTAVRSIGRLEDGAVEVEVRDGHGADGALRGRWLIDASGPATVVGRHLGTRRTLPDLRKVAYFEHFRGVRRHPGERAGYPVIIFCREGWFWLIPIDAERTSVGLVMDAGAAARVGVPAKRMLAWGLERCPVAARWTAGAEGPEDNRVVADFSYTCRPYAGPGYFLVGDAATFVDPVFSTGVCLGMASAVEAVDGVAAILAGTARAGDVRRRYARFVEGGSDAFFRFVRGSYRHEFRELFLHGTGPFEVRKAVVSVLSGHVFPRPAWRLRWRLAMFHAFVRLQTRLPIVPRRPEFSLLLGRTVDRRAGEALTEPTASR